MFGKLKKGMGELKANTEIEADYLMAKSKNNFDHPTNMLNAIKEYQDMYDSTEELSHRINSWVDKYQEFLNTETKMVERLNDCANKQIGVQAGSLKQFAGGEQQLAALRQNHLSKVIEQVQVPIKKYLSEQAPIKTKIEQTNKAWIELRYWRKKGGNSAAEQEASMVYDSHCEQLNALFQSNKASDLTTWLRFFCDSQLEFAQASVSVSPRI